MANKGFAVISGSNTVVAKILENGTVTFGSAAKPVNMSISGTLVFGGLSGSAGVTTGVANGVLQVGSSGTASIGQLGASQISSDFPGASNTVSGALAQLSASIKTVQDQVGPGGLNVSGSAGVVAVDFVDGDLGFTSSDSNLTVSVASDGSSGATVSLDLSDSPSFTNVTASGKVITPQVSASAGDLTLAAGANIVKVLSNLSSSGDFTTAGELTVNGPGESVFEGSLRVKGDLLIDGATTTVNTTNLTVEDAIILVGSGSNASNTDLGIVFGSTSQRALSVEDGTFKLGTVTDDASDANLAVTADGTLELGTLTASSQVSGSTVLATNLTASVISGSTVHANSLVIPNASLSVDKLSSKNIFVDVGTGLDVSNNGTASLGGSAISISLDLGELDAKTSIVAADSIAIVDSADSNASKKLSYSNLTSSLLSDLAGTGLQSSGGKLAVKYGSNAGEAVEGNKVISITGSAQVLVNGSTSSQSVTLGSGGGFTIGLPDTISLGNVTVTGSLTANGNVTLGSDSADLVQVSGQFRIPVFTTASVPAAYTDSASNYVGHMFYLSGSGDATWAQGNKWYFNEGGEWFASPFYVAP